MPLFRRRRQESVDPDDRSPQTGLKYKDLMVMAQLIEAGADMTQPRHALYFSYFPDQTTAETAGAATEALGFQWSVRKPIPEYPDQWPLVCELHDVVLDIDRVRDNTDYFEALAVEHSGNFDGWEASV